MRMKKFFVILIVISVFSGLALLFSYGIEGGAKEREFYEISVIGRGKTSDSLAAMKQGIDQAASDFRVDVSYITLTEENDLQEQMELIQREMNNGADAILISAANSEGLKEAVEEAGEKIPVVAIESPVNSDSIKAYISANNSEMGKSLAKVIIQGGIYKRKIAVLENSENCGNISDRCSGVYDTLKAAGAEVILYKLSDNTQLAAGYVSSILKDGSADVLVCLDSSMLEITAQAIQAGGQEDIALYGIGASGKIASFLEKKIIHTIVAQNDFNIGYLGVEAAVDGIEKKGSFQNAEIEYMIINSANMYDTRCQRLLFPFVR